MSEPDWHTNPWDHFGPNGESLRCAICGGPQKYKHDHKADNSGLDDGPPLKSERPYTRRLPLKSADELAAIRKRAWETRRGKDVKASL